MHWAAVLDGEHGAASTDVSPLADWDGDGRGSWPMYRPWLLKPCGSIDADEQAQLEALLAGVPKKVVRVVRQELAPHKPCGCDLHGPCCSSLSAPEGNGPLVVRSGVSRQLCQGAATRSKEHRDRAATAVRRLCAVTAPFSAII